MTDSAPSADRRALLQNALQAITDLQARLDAVEQARREPAATNQPIAIIGLSCRFPGGADDPEAYWQLLREGRDAIREVPADRWTPTPPSPIGSADRGGPETQWYGGFLDGIDQFEPQFFGISPREANTMDPQQRLVLEVSWEALERAGMIPATLADSQTGVFIGVTTTDYARIALRVDPEEMDVYTATGSALNVVAGRVAYILGLHGPTMAVDTACSSSLVAIHLACQSLRTDECSLALAGGVNALLDPEPFVVFNRWGMMAPDGRCKTFDAAADGFVRAEGCGILVLKRLSDALAAGDNIFAVIRGSAVNEDGRSSGLTVPNGLAQQAVIRSALAAAGLQPAQISYIETHGTGTSLGDPIEVEAIGAALGEGRTTPLTIGSVKTNIGHAESASGVAGLIKTVLAIQHNELPPHLHLKARSPRIPWPKFPIHIPTERTPWLAGSEPRRAGVSSFGFSGVNAHVILEEAPGQLPVNSEQVTVTRAVTLSARSEPALRQYAGRMADFLATHPSVALADVAHTTHLGRTHFAQRAAFLATTLPDLAGKLADFARGEAAPGVIGGQVVFKERPKIAFLFTGQGSQYPGMGRQLYETESIFRAALDRCDEILQREMGESLLPILYPCTVGSGQLGVDGQMPPTANSQLTIDRLDQTHYTQPALFAIEYALAQLWMAWGVQPTFVMGHSVGEYVAACLAGVFSLEDGLKLIAARGRLMGALPAGGQMAAVFASPERVAAAVQPYADRVSLAAHNGPENIVISGDGAAVAEIVADFEAQGVKARSLNVSHAFHSPLMAPMLDEFERVAASIRMSAPRLRLISNVTAQPVGEEAARPGYWRQHVRQAVRFAESLAALQTLGCAVFVEVGPNPTLIGMGQRCLPEDPARLWIPSLRKGRGGQPADDWQSLLAGLSELYVRGLEVEWNGLDQPSRPRRVALPTYPFQRSRYWVSAPRRAALLPASQQPFSLTRTPHSPDLYFTQHLAADAPAYLADHRIYGTVIFPGAGYISLALEAAQSLGGTASRVLDLGIYAALTIPDTQAATLQMTLHPETPSRAAFEIFSAPETAGPLLIAAPEWTRHASGTLELAETGAPQPADLADWQARCAHPLDAADYYRRLEAIGLGYGPRFRGLQALWRAAETGEALGQIDLPAPLAAELGQYRLHPALLDACFQVVGAALPDPGQAGEVYLPVGLERLDFYQSPALPLWCYAQVQSLADSVILANLTLLDGRGQVSARLSGLRIQRAPAQALQRIVKPRLDNWFYELTWVAQPLAVQPLSAAPTADSRWLVLAGPGGFGQALADELRGRGAVSAVQMLDDGRFDVETAARWLEAAQESGPLTGVAALWGLATGEGDPDARQEYLCGNLLALIQALAQTRSAPRLWLVTRGAQPVAGEVASPAGLAQSPLWGLGRTLAQEFPNLWGGLVDLDPAEGAASTGPLADHLLRPDGEDQAAWRSGQRYVARLARLIPPPAAPEVVELAVTQSGVLDGVSLRPAARNAPGPGEVEIRVLASGLNFRDVLNVLGMYPGEIPLGNECAGVVAAVGEGVSGVRPGECVIALAAGAFRSYLTTPADLVFPKPRRLTFAEAAATPTAFLTAWYGLHALADLQPRQRVLIHAAAGGVGLAAVRLAQRAGAEVFATAGIPAKHQFLRALGVEHIFSSRTADFAAEIRRLTQGRGVDVVLNSLSDAFIPEGLAALAEGGHFLEIGKRGIWTPEQVAERFPQVDYHVYDLAAEMAANPARLQAALRQILADLEAGALAPLPTRSFPSSAAPEALRFMAQARHIGRLAITFEPPKTPRPDGAYLITGGLGGLGLEVAGWLAAEGARTLVLVGRHAPSPAAAARIADLEARGARVIVAQVDVARRADAAALLERLEAEWPPLRGVVHAAGIADDSLLAQQDWMRFENVLAPKLAGAWNLHSLTRHLPLDFFLLFSAGAALLGSAGQGSYAAANAFLDALAFHRRALGLTGLSINWGAWAEVGMAARMGRAHHERWQSLGMATIQPEQGVQALAQLLSTPVTQAAVIPIQWEVFSRALTSAPPFLRDLLAAAAPATGKAQPLGKVEARPQWIDRLQQADPAGRQNLLEELVRGHVAGVLGLGAAHSIDPSQALTEMGLDSLMAVELSNRLRASLNHPLPSTLAFEQRTVSALVGYLSAAVLPKLLDAAAPAETAAPERPAVPAAAADEDNAARLLQNFDQLSDDDVDRLLRAMSAGEEPQ
jgi:acyl transferase domain-containing protein/acyl carrier protein